MTELLQREGIPPGFLTATARSLHEVLPGPTLIRCPGEREPALLVTVLQHGNEDTGLLAIQALLREYAGRELPRRLVLFVANVAAARAGVRHLDGQADYNRSWPGTESEPSAETALMDSVMAALADVPLFAAIDVHNNTGSNPHYAAFNVLQRPVVQLARLFSNTMVLFERPRGVMTQAFTGRCPAVVLECGKVGNAAGTEHARAFIDACMNMESVPEDSLGPNEVDLFHTVAQVKVRPEGSFGFGPGAHTLSIDPDIDRHNFQELPSGTALGTLDGHLAEHLLVLDPRGEDVAQRFLVVDGGVLRLRRSVMPSMLTLDERVVRQDCLCYFMERLSDPI